MPATRVTGSQRHTATQQPRACVTISASGLVVTAYSPIPMIFRSPRDGTIKADGRTIAGDEVDGERFMH
jgi:hypothetical protein